MFDEYFIPTLSFVSSKSDATLPIPDRACASSSTTIDQDTPSPSICESTRKICQSRASESCILIKEISIWFETSSSRMYGFEQCDAVDILMMERFKLDEYPNRKPVDPTRYRDADHAGCQDTRKSTLGSAQFRGEKLVRWSSKKQKCTVISTTEAEYISSFECHCHILQHCATLKDKHIVVRYHFIKEQVENTVVELYFVKTAYQLADIFTKALARERFEFLINRLGMQSITLEKLKVLAESEDEE
nr:copia protein [Tanacetum cinerariifolium]